MATNADTQHDDVGRRYVVSRTVRVTCSTSSIPLYYRCSDIYDVGSNPTIPNQSSDWSASLSYQLINMRIENENCFNEKCQI